MTITRLRKLKPWDFFKSEIRDNNSGYNKKAYVRAIGSEESGRYLEHDRSRTASVSFIEFKFVNSELFRFEVLTNAFDQPSTAVYLTDHISNILARDDIEAKRI